MAMDVIPIELNLRYKKTPAVTMQAFKRVD